MDVFNSPEYIYPDGTLTEQFFIDLEAKEDNSFNLLMLISAEPYFRLSKRFCSWEKTCDRFDYTIVFSKAMRSARKYASKKGRALIPDIESLRRYCSAVIINKANQCYKDAKDRERSFSRRLLKPNKNANVTPEEVADNLQKEAESEHVLNLSLEAFAQTMGQEVSRESHEEASVSSMDVREALSSLADEDKDILFKYIQNGITAKEYARVKEINEKTASQRFYRTKQKARKILQEKLG